MSSNIARSRTASGTLGSARERPLRSAVRPKPGSHSSRLSIHNPAVDGHGPAIPEATPCYEAPRLQRWQPRDPIVSRPCFIFLSGASTV